MKDMKTSEDLRDIVKGLTDGAATSDMCDVDDLPGVALHYAERSEALEHERAAMVEALRPLVESGEVKEGELFADIVQRYAAQNATLRAALERAKLYVDDYDEAGNLNGDWLAVRDALASRPGGSHVR